MNKIISLLALIVLLAACSETEKPSPWKKLTAFPGDAKHFATATYDNDAYLFFGEKYYNLYSNAAFKYESTSDEWSELSSFTGEGRTKATGFALDDAIYIIGGELVPDEGSYDIIRTDEVLKYNVKADSWENLSAFPGGPTAGGMTFKVGDEVFYGFGQYGLESENSRTFWKYAPAVDEWLRMVDFPGNLPTSYNLGNVYSALFTRFTNFVYQDKIFIITGTFVDQPEMWEFNATTNTWSQLTDLTFESDLAEELFLVRGGSGTYTHNDKCYFFLGNRLNDEVVANSFHEFDPETHNWRILNPVVSSGGLGSVAFIIYTGNKIIFGTDLSYVYKHGGYQLWQYKL